MRLSHPKRGVLGAYLAANPKGCINRLSPLWYPLIVAMPLALAVLALLGYVHTAGTLWTYTGTLDGREHMIPVTLADIGLTLLVTIIVAVAVRNLPAFLEIALLQRIAISAGSRYTIKTLTGYIIVITAAFTIFSTFGLSWSQIQWLVAALGVGIGFGLQEIVANLRGP